MEALTEAQQELYEWLVDYIRRNQHSPSIRQMMKAMGLRSPAPIQSRLDHLKTKGYIDWTEGKARTIRIVDEAKGVPILGAIAAGSLVETFTDTVERLDLAMLPLKPQDFALRVRGDSMIDALIDEGDIVIMRPVEDPTAIKDGTIVAARPPASPQARPLGSCPSITRSTKWNGGSTLTITIWPGSTGSGL
ncbi:MAG: repressor LexA, partial [Leptolyngbya sp. SIO4C5]|nr:repressor LexA [Leptolyngbya sp. SIO4C5]